MPPLRNPKNFFDRELSWLAFNHRVLEEALDSDTPLLERLKFLGIVSTNLDEFFMVRVSGVQEHVRSGIRRKSPAGLTPAQQFSMIHQEVHAQDEAMLRCFREDIVPALEAQDIYILPPGKLSRRAKKELRTRFDEQVFPVLTPLAVDAGHPFPRLKNLSINLIVKLEGERRANRGETLVAIVQVPSVLPRLMPIPAQRDKLCYVLLEEVIMENVGLLFPGMKVVECAAFRVTRDADIEYKEIEAEDLLKYIETEIRERERGMAVRLQISNRASPSLTTFLISMLNLADEQVYRANGALALNELSEIWKLDGREDLKEEPFTPSIRKELRGPGSIFGKIRQGDILLHHPYESFVPVVDFIDEAARDPKVLAIKQTLYRTSGDSPIIDALIEAAENGKQVAALVELKARFDEENNIVWARRLEEAGVHVVYGLVGLKTHCKVALVVRRESNRIRRYVHLGTGNYNPATARLYTDIGMFTCDPGFADDASELFNMLTGYAHSPRWQRMVVAPDDLRPRTLDLIAGERERAEKGKPARIRAKMNSLVDPEIILELYKASCAGVKIELCVRGICCLKPGVPGVSENITVFSIVDRFLEHSRIFIFGDGDDVEVYASSADWMDRNMDRRIEVMFPIIQTELKQRCVRIFETCMQDNVKSRLMMPDGRYRKSRPKSGAAPFRSQVEFLKNEENVAVIQKPGLSAAAQQPAPSDEAPAEGQAPRRRAASSKAAARISRSAKRRAARATTVALNKLKEEHAEQTAANGRQKSARKSATAESPKKADDGG